MNKIKYLLFVLIIFLVPKVYALEVDVTNIVTSPETSGQGKYRGTEILNTGGQYTYNVKTRYQGRLSRIIYNLPLPSELGDCFTTNVTYTVTMYMETNDWNNKFGTVKVRPYSSSSTNWSNGSVTYVSYKKIYFTFKIPSSDTTCYDFVWVDLPSTNLSTTGITQISNWNLNKITLNDPTISSGGSGGSGGTSPTPTPNTTQQIIDSQNQNAQDIMENDDQNTQDIISSIQETTSQVSDTINNVFLGKCTNIFNFPYDNSNPYSIVATYDDAYRKTDYVVNLDTNVTYNFSYQSNKDFGSVAGTDTVEFYLLKDGVYNTIIHPNSKKGSFTVSSGGSYTLRLDCNKNGSTCTFYDFMISTESDTYCAFGTNTEQNKIDELNKKLDGLSAVINSEEVPSIDIDIDLASDTPISDLLLMPLNIINKVQTANSGICTPYVLPFDFFGGNNTLTLPCIDLEDYLGHDVYTVLDTILCFYFAYEIAMLCISIYNNVTSLNDGFDALYEPKHGAPDGASSYIGRHGGGKT